MIKYIILVGMRAINLRYKIEIYITEGFLESWIFTTYIFYSYTHIYIPILYLYFYRQFIVKDKISNSKFNTVKEVNKNNKLIPWTCIYIHLGINSRVKIMKIKITKSHFELIITFVRTKLWDFSLSYFNSVNTLRLFDIFLGFNRGVYQNMYFYLRYTQGKNENCV